MLDGVLALMVGRCGIGSGDGNDGHGVGVVLMDVVGGMVVDVVVGMVLYIALDMVVKGVVNDMAVEKVDWIGHGCRHWHNDCCRGSHSVGCGCRLIG